MIIKAIFILNGVDYDNIYAISKTRNYTIIWDRVSTNPEDVSWCKIGEPDLYKKERKLIK